MLDPLVRYAQFRTGGQWAGRMLSLIDDLPDDTRQRLESALLAATSVRPSAFLCRPSHLPDGSMESIEFGLSS